MKARKIELKTLTELGEDKKQSFAYADAIKAILIGNPTQGTRTDDVLRAVDIQNEVNKANDILHLSEEDYQWLVGRMNTTQWTMPSPELAEFIKSVRGAPQVDLEPA